MATFGAARSARPAVVVKLAEERRALLRRRQEMRPGLEECDDEDPELDLAAKIREVGGSAAQDEQALLVGAPGGLGDRVVGGGRRGMCRWRTDCAGASQARRWGRSTGGTTRRGGSWLSRRSYGACWRRRALRAASRSTRRIETSSWRPRRGPRGRMALAVGGRRNETGRSRSLTRCTGSSPTVRDVAPPPLGGHRRRSGAWQ